jgi:ferredoxin
MPKIKIDREKCIGCGLCPSLCPKTFEMDDNKAKVKKQPDKITCEKEAADSCPVEAIILS